MIKKIIKNREKYQALSLEQKRMICKYNNDHNGIKQTQLIVHFTRELFLDHPIKKQTMNGFIIVSNKFFILLIRIFAFLFNYTNYRIIGQA